MSEILLIALPSSTIQNNLYLPLIVHVRQTSTTVFEELFFFESRRDNCCIVIAGRVGIMLIT